MFRIRALLALASLWIAGTSIAVAAAAPGPVAPQDWSKLSNDELSTALLAASMEDPAQYCRILSPLFGELVKRSPNDTFLEEQARVDMACAIDERRWRDAYAHMLVVEAKRGEPNSFGAYGVQVAWAADEDAASVDRIAVLARLEDPGELVAIEVDQFFYLSQRLVVAKRIEERKRLTAALVGSPHVAKLDPDLRSAFAANSIEFEADSIAPDAARGLLAAVHGPYELRRMLAGRRFQRLWPAIEARAGDRMAIALGDHLSIARGEFAKFPGNPEKRKTLVSALFFSGRFEDAIGIARQIDRDPSNIAKLVEDDAWTINTEVYALDALGRVSEAEAAFDLLAAIPYDPERTDWLVNFVINRASRLVELGNWRKGLEAAELAARVAEKSGSNYAKMLVRRDKVCALVNLGRAADAAPLLEQLESNRADYYGAAVQAMLCAGQAQKAAALTIEALKGADSAKTMIDDLQGHDFEFFYTRSMLPGIRDELRNRPDVDAAFSSVARDIPARFVPDLAFRRSKLPGAQPR